LSATTEETVDVRRNVMGEFDLDPRTEGRGWDETLALSASRGVKLAARPLPPRTASCTLCPSDRGNPTLCPDC
jgi:hypothetical protein